MSAARDGAATTAGSIPLLQVPGLADLQGDAAGYCGPDGCAPAPSAANDAAGVGTTRVGTTPAAGATRPDTRD